MRNSTTTQFVAKEGWGYIAFMFIVFAISFMLSFFSIIFFMALLFTVFIFRNPERLPAEDDDMAVLAPSDGTISMIEKIKLEDKKEYLKVTIKKSLFDVSILRAPTKLSIKSMKKRYGLFLPPQKSLSKKLGEKISLTCRSAYSSVSIHIVAGAFARKIELFKTIGPLKSTQRFGLLLDGAVELCLPLNCRVKVAVGDRVKSGESVLGYFAHKGESSEK